MNRSIIITLGIVVVLAVMLTNANAPQKGYQIGDNIKDFNLENIDGKNVSLADYPNAKGFIIVFTCNTCPYAKAYESRIVELDNKFSSKGFQLIAINPNDIIQKPDDDLEGMKKKSNEQNFNFPYLKDETQQVARDFGARKTPHTFVLHKEDENIILKYIGAIDDSPNDPEDVSEMYVANAVNELLSDEKVTMPEKRSIGCSIKWSK